MSNEKREVNVSQFASLVTAGGTRKAYADSEGSRVSFPTKDGYIQSVNLRHRSGSITQLHMHGSSVGGAYHTDREGVTSRLPAHAMGDFQQHVRNAHAHFKDL